MNEREMSELQGAFQRINKAIGALAQTQAGRAPGAETGVQNGIEELARIAQEIRGKQSLMTKRTGGKYNQYGNQTPYQPKRKKRKQ